MIFLRRLSLKAAAFKKRSGQVTLWLALMFLVFLSLYLVCLQSVQKQQKRQQAEQALEAGLFSLFSEYEPHLFEQYDLFYIDTSFRSGTEQTDEVCSHLWRFIEENITSVSGSPVYGLELEGVGADNLVRATDGDGAVFYRQAVQIMKEKTGVSLVEDWILQDVFQERSEENINRFLEGCETYEGTVQDYEGEEDEINPDAGEWDGLRNSFTLQKAVPDGCQVSQKAVNLASAPSHRTLSYGVGYASGTENGLINKQWFISYLGEYFKDAQKMLAEQREDGYLDYQVEYIIGGKASDGENLEQVIRQLLLMREGANYAFLLSHPELREQAELLAMVLVGLTGNAALIKGMEQLILLGWSYGESLVEVRQLLGGYELSVAKATEDWQVPLSSLLSVVKNPGEYDIQTRIQRGISYQSFLRIFLMLQSAETLSMRALDIIEGEVSGMTGCEHIHLDHCVEQMTVQVWMPEIYLERTYGYGQE